LIFSASFLRVATRDEEVDIVPTLLADWTKRLCCVVMPPLKIPRVHYVSHSSNLISEKANGGIVLRAMEVNKCKCNSLYQKT
jgi:hypothetical protein